MSVATTCPHCARVSVVSADLIGRWITCYGCSQKFLAFADPAISDAPEAEPVVPAVDFFCPSCNRALNGPAGQKLYCPVCGQKVLVPQPKENRTILGFLSPPPDPSRPCYHQPAHRYGRFDKDEGGPATDGKVVASLVLGIIGLVAWCIPIAGLPVTITGLCLGAAGGRGRDRGMALAGLILCIIGLLLSAMNSLLGAYLGATGKLRM